MPLAPRSSARAAEVSEELSGEVLVERGGTMGAIGCRATSEEEPGVHPVGEGDGAVTLAAPAGAQTRPDLGVSLAAHVAPSPSACPSPPALGGGGAQQPQAAPERAATSATSRAAGPTGASIAARLQENERALPPTCGSRYVIGRFRLTEAV